MDRWKQLGQLLAQNDPDAERLRTVASQPIEIDQNKSLVDPLLLEY